MSPSCHLPATIVSPSYPSSCPTLLTIYLTADKTVFRAAANCNSERPDPSRPFIQLQHGIHFNFPTWIDVTRV